MTQSLNSHGPPPTENDDAGGEEHEDGGDAECEGVAGVVAKALHILQELLLVSQALRVSQASVPIG